METSAREAAERLAADDASLAGQSVDALVRLVERVAEVVPLGTGQTVFVAWCGAGAIPALIAAHGASVGGIDPDPQMVMRAARALPGGLFRCGDPASLDPSEPWGVVVAVGAFSRVIDEDSRRGLLARMAAMAAHALVLLDVGPDPEVGPGWVLRATAEIGCRGVQFLHDDDPASGRTRTHVLASVEG